MVVILGAGIAGAATAYYLLGGGVGGASLSGGNGNHNNVIKVIDAVGPATAASGNAGAYLSKKWGDGTKTEALHHISFQLHQQLAKELKLKSFHELSSSSVVHQKMDQELSIPEEAEHADNDNDIDDNLLNIPTSALVDPQELTKALLSNAVDRGAQMIIGTVNDFKVKDNSVTAIEFVDGSELSIDDGEDIVVALGPWSCRVEDWLKIPMPIEGVVSTYLVWEGLEQEIMPLRGCPPPVLFCQENSLGCHLEILQRPNQSLYVSGCGGSQVLSPAVLRGPERPHPKDNPTLPNLSRAKAAETSLKSITYFSDLPSPPNHVGACIRPGSPDGLPIVGKLSTTDNVYVATGGGAWGITWGPLIGLAMASLLQGEDPPIRMSPISPNRYNTLVYKALLKQRTTEAWM